MRIPHLGQTARLVAALSVLPFGAVIAQQGELPRSPFLFISLPSVVQPGAVAALDAGFNERAFEPVGGERWEQRANALVSLSSRVAVHGQVGFAHTLESESRASEQVEVMTTPYTHGGFSVGANAGFRHEYGGTDVGLFRLTGARTLKSTSLAADVLFEKPFSSLRDKVDVITSFAVSRALGSRVWLGAEAVGSDLEGFWEKEEAEGGARLLVGPTVAVGVSGRLRLVVGGGPVIRVTRNDPITGAPPVGVLQDNGYVLRTSLRFGW